MVKIKILCVNNNTEEILSQIQLKVRTGTRRRNIPEDTSDIMFIEDGNAMIQAQKSLPSTFRDTVPLQDSWAALHKA